MEKKDVTMMLVLGLVCLVEGTSDVSGCDDFCRSEAAVGEDVLTLLPDVSSPSAPVVPSRCDDDFLCRSCLCCSFKRMSAMISAAVRVELTGSVVSGCDSGRCCCE